MSAVFQLNLSSQNTSKRPSFFKRCPPSTLTKQHSAGSVVSLAAEVIWKEQIHEQRRQSFHESRVEYNSQGSSFMGKRESRRSFIQEAVDYALEMLEDGQVPRYDGVAKKAGSTLFTDASTTCNESESDDASEASISISSLEDDDEDAGTHSVVFSDSISLFASLSTTDSSSSSTISSDDDFLEDNDQIHSRNQEEERLQEIEFVADYVDGLKEDASNLIFDSMTSQVGVDRCRKNMSKICKRRNRLEERRSRLSELFKQIDHCTDSLVHNFRWLGDIYQEHEHSSAAQTAIKTSSKRSQIRAQPSTLKLARYAPKLNPDSETTKGNSNVSWMQKLKVIPSSPSTSRQRRRMMSHRHITVPAKAIVSNPAA